MAPTINPNLGIYKDRPPIALSPRMLQDGLNFRVKEGKLTNLNLGWERFEPDITLDGPVKLIDQFFIRGQSEILIFGTPEDLYQYDEVGNSVAYINPIYDTGTAAASGTAVTGTGTNWDPEAKAGDFIHFGDADYHDPTGVWFEIQSRTNDTQLVLTATAGTVADGPYTIRKTFTGDASTIWSTDTFVKASVSGDDEWWATNGLDFPVRWNGTDPEVEVMSALGFTSCKVLAVYQNMMIFANLIQGGESLPTDIINSDIGEPSDTSTGLSEQFRVHSGTDEIRGMLPLGDTLAIYSERTVTLAQFVGDPFIFAFRNVISGTGAIAHRAIADFGDRHEFLGRDSQYVFDGSTVREIGKQIWRDMLRQQDPVRIEQAYAHFDEENGDLIWSIPLTTDTGAGEATAAPAKAVGEHYLEDVGPNLSQPVSIRSFPFTATGYYSRQAGITWDTLTDEWQSYNFRWNDRFFFAAFPFNMAGDAMGRLYTVNTSQNADGAALPSHVKFGRRAVQDGRLRGLVRRVYPFVTRFDNEIDVTVYLSDHAMGPATITHTDAFDQTLPEGGHFTSPFRRGRFMELEFSSDGPGQPWEISGYDLELDSGGKR